jgi:hypothetical protein
MADQELSLQEQLDLATDAMAHYKALYLKSNEVTEQKAAQQRRCLATALFAAAFSEGRQGGD